MTSTLPTTGRKYWKGLLTNGNTNTQEIEKMEKPEWIELLKTDVTSFNALRWRADLSDANLSDANLIGADLRGADLRRADLRGADLRGADLSGADLSSADLTDAVLPHFQICPEEGAFIAYKKLDTGVIALTIPAEAKRTSSLVGRKCRAEFALPHGSGKSSRRGKYIKGEMYHPDGWDDDIRIECTHGVHFFITRREAEEYKE